MMAAIAAASAIATAANCTHDHGEASGESSKSVKVPGSKATASVTFWNGSRSRPSATIVSPSAVIEHVSREPL